MRCSIVLGLFVLAAAFVMAPPLVGTPRSYGDRSQITEPRPHTLVRTRSEFRVIGFIQNYEAGRAAGFHYWISVALVDDTGKPVLHWPKIYVKSVEFDVRASDGGDNPYPGRQLVQILLLGVDEVQNERIVKWLQRGLRERVWEGLPVRQNEIIDAVPVFFP